MTKRVFILHGWQGSPQENWFPWLKSKLEERGIAVSVPRLPDPDVPRLDNWINTVKSAVGKPDKKSYLIGHSLGNITILRYLESLSDGEEIGGAVLVAGFTDDLGIRELGNFFSYPINWERIRLGCKKFVVINSDNDPYIALKHSSILKEKLNSEVIIEHDMGHFNIKELHVALNVLLKMMKD